MREVVKMSEQYIEYKVISKYDERKMSDEVTELLGKGWVLIGNLVVTTVVNGNVKYVQAMGKVAPSVSTGPR